MSILRHASETLDLPEIPIDLTISRGLPALKQSELKVTDSSGNLVFLVDSRSSSVSASPNRHEKKILVDALKNPIFTIVHNKDGGWQGFKGNSCDKEDLMFTVEGKVQSRLGTELEVFLIGQNLGNLQPNFRVQGSPFHRSCTIYGGNFIVAQTSAMYKLGKAIVGRHKFRLTVYPGIDHAFVAAVLVIFFGRW